MAKTGTALPVIAGGAALLMLSGRKKKKGTSLPASSGSRWGIRIVDDCKGVEVTDPELFNKFMYGAFNELVETDPSLSLIQMTDALFGDVAPSCSGFPEEPESAEVAELYATIARHIGRFMIHDSRVDINASKLVDEATKISFVDWYIRWRNYPSSDIPKAPENQVAFSSDMSTYQVGPKWYEETVVPFVASSGQEGRLETVFEDFVASRGVMVGRVVKPISELPQDSPIVNDFLDGLEEAINNASAQVSGG